MTTIGEQSVHTTAQTVVNTWGMDYEKAVVSISRSMAQLRTTFPQETSIYKVAVWFSAHKGELGKYPNYYALRNAISAEANLAHSATRSALLVVAQHIPAHLRPPVNLNSKEGFSAPRQASTLSLAAFIAGALPLAKNGAFTSMSAETIDGSVEVTTVPGGVTFKLKYR